MGDIIACAVLIVLPLGYIMFVICKTFKDHENDIKSLKQRIFELEDEVKKLKK